MKYDIYGIGNALVDKEFEVTEAFLQAEGIEKGMMSLIDEAQQINLLSQLKQTFGLKKRAGGGSAANSMVAASQFGAKTFYACKVANDETGEFYRKDLHAAGVTTRLDELNLSDKGTTGKCMVMVTPDAERTMNTFLGITADFCEKELHLDDLKQAQYLYIEGYLVTSDVSRAAAIKARNTAQNNGVKVAMTFSDPAMVTYFKNNMAEMMGEHIDILFGNEEECMTFTNTDNLDNAIVALNKIADKLVITLGSKGALVVNGTKQIQISAQTVTAIDTNGAGDMFAGAFMYGITQGWDDQQSASLANQAAANIVTVFGARLDSATHQQLLDSVTATIT
jgi:sugar/nucleoside kinase (ribokinase family)